MLEDEEFVAQVLETGEADVSAGRPLNLREIGFWRAVAIVKRDPDLVEAYADRVARLDQRAFSEWTRLALPVGWGALILGLATALGLAVVGVAYALEAPWNGLFVLAGTGMLLGTTHGLAHLVVGAAVGIRFTGWFLNGPTRLQPGLKIEYASYLRTNPASRAWMHASGAIVTKILPFAMLGAALAASTPWWTPALLLLIGFVQIGTDIAFSTKQSDWKKFRREMSFGT